MEHSKILLNPLIQFYSNNLNLHKLLLILFFKNYKYNNNKNIKNIFSNSYQTQKISLRLIDWFVTNYCKKNRIFIKNSTDNKTEILNIYQSYKSNLKAFSKQYFDPFRRNKKLYFTFNLTISNENNNFLIFDNNQSKNINNINSETIETTIGQLNFFKWIIENHIYEYICENKKLIENDMIYIQKENIKKKKDSNNLIYKNIIDTNGNTKTITRKKRVELSKSQLNHIALTREERTIYF
jgi:hypothetical protein